MMKRKGRLTTQDDDIMVRCVNCGTPLDLDSGTLSTPDWYKETRFVHYCRECQKAQFEDYAGLVSVDMAFYLCCASYNLPFVPEAIPSPRNADGETWEIYLENLRMLDRDVNDNGETAAFSDGITDLAVIFDGKIPSAPIFAGGLTAGGVAEKLEGTRAQRKNWGLSYTTVEYKELDRLYGIQATSYKDSGIDEELEFNLREICKLLLLYSKQLAEGEIKLAKATYDVVSKIKADNLMRKKDEAPAADKQIDTLISRMENAGIIKKGKTLTLADVQNYIAHNHPHYAEGLDIVDQMLVLMENTIRLNEGRSPLAELPVSLQINPLFGELDPGLTEEQKRLLGEMGLTPIKREKVTGSGGR